MAGSSRSWCGAHHATAHDTEKRRTERKARHVEEKTAHIPHTAYDGAMEWPTHTVDTT